MDEALILARAQFGLNIGFHILFTTISIGLAWVLLWFRVRYQMTRDEAWLRTYELWVRVLDPGAQFLDADARRPLEQRRRAGRRQLVGGDLQSFVSVPPDAHAARLGNHRLVRRRRTLGVAAARRAARCSSGYHATLRR